jgi:putative ABC transport system permease protein
MRGSRFKVVGVVQPKGFLFGMDVDDSVYMPITTAHNLGGSSEINQITIRIPEAKNIDRAMNEIRRILKFELEDKDFTVASQGEMLSSFNDFMSVLTIVTFAIAAISLLVGGIGIMNIMMVTVTERTKEIGIRKAVGASFTDIMFQFFSEAVIIAVSGGIIGILASLLIISVFGPYSPFPLKASGASVALAFSFSSALGIFFGTYPAVKAARTDPITALRFE